MIRSHVFDGALDDTIVTAKHAVCTLPLDVVLPPVDATWWQGTNGGVSLVGTAASAAAGTFMGGGALL